jgi:hypothetical protein
LEDHVLEGKMGSEHIFTWCSDYSEPGGRHRLHKNSYLLKNA